MMVSPSQGDLRSAFEYVGSVEADDPGEEVDLLDALLRYGRIHLRYLYAKIIERGFAQSPRLTERALQGLCDITRADEVGSHRDRTGQFADRFYPVVNRPGGESLSADEQSMRSTHIQPPAVREPGRSHELGLRPADLGAAQSLRAKQQHLALRHVDRVCNPVIALLRLALRRLQLRCSNDAKTTVSSSCGFPGDGRWTSKPYRIIASSSACTSSRCRTDKDHCARPSG